MYLVITVSNALNLRGKMFSDICTVCELVDMTCITHFLNLETHIQLYIYTSI